MASSKLENKLDAVVRDYIKLIETDESGNGNDFVTGDPLSWSNCEVSHCIKRSHRKTRWEPLNLHLQLPENNQLNEKSSKAQKSYELAIEKEYGPQAMQRLRVMKRQTWNPWDFEVKQMIAEFRAANKKLAREKNFEVKLN
jgi:hypothetical protein